jgi:hypothetical protein
MHHVMATSQNNNNDEEITNDSNNMVPDVLLSLAKDARYLNQCQTLLLEILPEHSAESTLAAGLLYTVFVLMRKGKSLGQEALGIEYSNDSKWRLMIGSLVASTGLFAMRRLADSNDEGANGNPLTSNETLRGRQRQLVYQQQRQRMMQGASTITTSETSELSRRSNEASSVLVEPTLQIPTTSTQQSLTPPASLRHQVKALLRQVARQLVPGLSLFIADDGPHSVDTTNNNTNNNLSLGTWLLRLHLAWYLLDAKYPTVMHRLFRLQQQQQGNERKLSHRPSSVRIVGMLIVVQALGTLIPHLGSRFVQWLADCFPPSPPLTNAGSSIQFYSNNESHLIEGTTSTALNHTGTPSTATTGSIRSCVICRMDRLHPACSVKCGHVMCWSCLQQWVHPTQGVSDLSSAMSSARCFGIARICQW